MQNAHIHDMPSQVSAGPAVLCQNPGLGANPCSTSPREFCAVVHVMGPMLLAIAVHAVYDVCVCMFLCMCVCGGRGGREVARSKI